MNLEFKLERISLPPGWADQIRAALEEDIGTGDLTALLIDSHQTARGTLWVREPAILCGTPWFEGAFKTLNGSIQVNWLAEEGEELSPGQAVAELEGPAQAVLSAERTALNFLQTLSAVATLTRTYVRAVAGTRAAIVDTRKTIPGLRLAQKYAVRIGGGTNHRLGLYDAILIKENHIAAAGSLAAVIERAKHLLSPGKFIQVEVEELEQLEQALSCGITWILLDNMSLEQQRAAVALAGGRAVLEVSGNVRLENLAAVAATGVDRISIGALTKDVRAIDFSLRLDLAATPIISTNQS